MKNVTIQLNGNPFTTTKNLSLQDLISELKLSGKRIAVEINQSIIPRSQYNQTFFNENDVVEIVTAIGGG